MTGLLIAIVAVVGSGMVRAPQPEGGKPLELHASRFADLTPYFRGRSSRWGCRSPIRWRGAAEVTNLQGTETIVFVYKGGGP